MDGLFSLSISHHHPSSSPGHCYLNLFHKPLVIHSQVMPSPYIPVPTFSLWSSCDPLVSLFIHWRLWLLVLSAPPTYFLSTSMMMPILHFCSSSLLTSTPVNFYAYYITHPFSWSCTWLFLFNKKFTPLKSQMQAFFLSLTPNSHISSPCMQSWTQTTTWRTILWFFRLFHSQFL